MTKIPSSLCLHLTVDLLQADQRTRKILQGAILHVKSPQDVLTTQMTYHVALTMMMVDRPFPPAGIVLSHPWTLMTMSNHHEPPGPCTKKTSFCS